MKTAMQEMYEYLCVKRDRAQDLRHKSLSEHYQRIAEMAFNKIPKERQQREDAVSFGNMQEFYDGTEKLAQDYYTTTYGK